MDNIPTSSPTKKSAIIYFDLETTGFNPYSNEIIEIAAVRQDITGTQYEPFLPINQECTDSTAIFSQLVKPRRSIPPKIQSITHITNEMVRDKLSILEVMKLFHKFCEGYQTIYFIAHNCIGFDKTFLNHAWLQLYNSHKLRLTCKVHYLCSMRMAQRVLPNNYSYKLSSLCKYFAIVQNNPHRALSDVYDVVHLVHKLFQRYKHNSLQTLLHTLECTVLIPV